MKIKTTLRLFTFCLFTIIAQGQESPEIVVTSGHLANVYSINFSPNNKFIITAGQDKTVRIWDRSLAQEFRVLYGHTGDVWKAVYTSDGKYIISVDGKGVLITWNHATGAIVKRNKLDIFSRSFTYIPNSTRVLIMKAGKIVEVDILTGEVVATHGVLSDLDLRLTNDGAHLITLTKKAGFALAIYNYKTQETVGELISNHDGAPTVITVSPNSKRVASFSLINKMVLIFDIDTRKIISSFEYTSKNVLKMAFTPDNKNLLIIDRNAEIAVYGVKEGKLKRRMNRSNTPAEMAAMKGGAYKIGTAWDMVISPDNTMVAIAQTLNEGTGTGVPPTTFMGGVLFDFKNNRELGRLAGFFKMPNHLSIASNSKYLISSLYNKVNGIRVWNMKEGNLERFIPTSGIAGASSDGSVFGAWVLSNKEKPILTVFNAKTIKPIFETMEVDALSDISFSADGTIMLTQEVYVDLKNYLNNKFFFRVWDVAAKKQIGDRIEFETNEMPIYKGIKMSPDGKYIIAQINSSEITCWEVATGKRTFSIPTLISYEFLLDFVPNSTEILISKTKPEYDLMNKRMTANMKWFTWNYVTGEASEPTFTGSEGVLFSGDFSDDGQYLVTGQGGYFGEVEFNVVIWDWATMKPICEMPGHHGEIKFVCFGSKGKRIYTTAMDGFIKIWEVAECKLAASMIAQNELDYIILSPDNYYKSSKGNNEGIGFRFNNSLYTIDQFDVRYNRPDKVLTSLGLSKFSVKLYAKAWEKRLSKMGFTPEDIEGQLALPKIDLPTKRTLPATTDQKKLNLNVKAWDEEYKLDRISIYINDVPAPQLTGISLKKKSTNKIDQDVDIYLSTGRNLVKVSVFNEQGLESLRESFQINYTPKVEKKPNLYIFSVGVSEFENKERNLKFAAQDASDLVKGFGNSQYFENVYAEQLYNEKATKENILKSANFLKKATTDDQVIIYISSHGLLDDNLDYYLAMHDVNFENPGEKGLPYDMVNNMLDGMDCRNRLILIDACHSGEIDKDDAVTRSSIAATNSNVKINHKSGTTMIRPKAGLKNSFTYMKTLFNDVSKGTGATVISAAGGYEFALESEDWNNGVFTYAILEGVKTRAADRNGDGFIYVSELKDYVSLKVVELTDGKQHPTTRSENTLNDFILFKVQPRGQNIIGHD